MSIRRSTMSIRRSTFTSTVPSADPSSDTEPVVRASDLRKTALSGAQGGLMW